MDGVRLSAKLTLVQKRCRDFLGSKGGRAPILQRTGQLLREALEGARNAVVFELERRWHQEKESVEMAEEEAKAIEAQMREGGGNGEMMGRVERIERDTAFIGDIAGLGLQERQEEVIRKEPEPY